MLNKWQQDCVVLEKREIGRARKQELQSRDLDSQGQDTRKLCKTGRFTGQGLWDMENKLPKISFFFFFFLLFRATHVAYRGSQERGWIRPTAAGLYQPQPRRIWASSSTYTIAPSNAESLTHWARPGIEPSTSWLLVRFTSAVSQWELLPEIYINQVSLSKTKRSTS